MTDLQTVFKRFRKPLQKMSIQHGPATWIFTFYYFWEFSNMYLYHVKKLLSSRVPKRLCRWRSHGEFVDCSYIASLLGYGNGLFLDVGAKAGPRRGDMAPVVPRNLKHQLQVRIWAPALYLSPIRCLAVAFFFSHYSGCSWECDKPDVFFTASRFLVYDNPKVVSHRL